MSRSCAEAVPRSRYPGYVYIILEDRFVKIGISHNPDARLHQLQAATARRLHLVDAFWFDDCSSIEGRLHSIFFLYRVHREWFDLPLVVFEHLLLVMRFIRDEKYAKPLEILDEFYQAMRIHLWQKT